MGLPPDLRRGNFYQHAKRGIDDSTDHYEYTSSSLYLPKSSPQQSKRENQEHEKSPAVRMWTGYERISAFISAISLFVLVLYACTTYGMLKNLSNQLEIMHGQWGTSYAQWLEMKGQSGKMQGQLEASQKQIRIDQRPWMFVDSPDVLEPLRKGDKVVQSIDIKNIGKTPAIDIWAIFMLDKVANGQDLNPLFLKPPLPGMTKEEWADTTKGPISSASTGILFPNSKTINTGAVWMKFMGRSRRADTVMLTLDDYEEMMAGKTYFIAHGIVAYRDQFNVLHWTKYCRILWRNNVLIPLKGTAGACTSYNGTDENQ
jgi:hypothetical protein